MNIIDLSRGGLQRLLGVTPAYHKLYQYYSEKNFRKHYRDALRSQWFSIEEMGRYQNEHLQQVIRHAYHNVPYYKNLFDKFKISVDEIKSSVIFLKSRSLRRTKRLFYKRYLGSIRIFGTVVN
jgi:hypothetical protein